MFGQVSNYDNKFYINGLEVQGLDNVDLSYSNSQKLVRLLGFDIGHTVVSGPVQQKVSLSHYLIYQDPIAAFTGSASVSGSINYNGSSYGFQSGYLEDYSINCAVGSVPKVSAGFVIRDELASGTKDAFGEVSLPPIYIPNQGSISVTCDGSTTNRVVGFDFAIKIPRQPLYSIGSKLSTEMFSPPVLEYVANVQIDIDDAFLSSGLAFLSGIDKKTVSFTIRGRDGFLLHTWTVPKASLAGESLSSSADGGLKLTLNYIGHS